MKILEVSAIIILCIAILCAIINLSIRATCVIKESYSAKKSSSMLTVNDNFQLSTIEFPHGVIMSYYPPDPASIKAPEGWSLCDGSNGTPNLRGRFILGHRTGEDNFNTISGADTKNIKIENIPPHEHSIHVQGGRCNWINSGNQVGNHQNLQIPACPDKGSGTSFKEDDVIQTDHSLDQLGIAQANSPPYYVMVYVMKII